MHLNLLFLIYVNGFYSKLLLGPKPLMPKYGFYDLIFTEVNHCWSMYQNAENVLANRKLYIWLVTLM